MTDRINAPEGWTHRSGYRLRGDGQSIDYDGPDGLRAWIEVDEDELLIGIEHNGTLVEHAIRDYSAKADALSRLETLMEEYA